MGDGPVASSIGRHCVLELYGCASELLNDRRLIANAIRDAAQLAGATVLEEICHAFTPQGVTAMALLAESHISIHTWPETGYAAADVFTCGDHTMPERACQHLAEILRPRSYELQQFERGRSQAPSTCTAPAADVGVVETPATTSEAAANESELCPVPSYVPISG